LIKEEEKKRAALFEQQLLVVPGWTIFFFFFMHGFRDSIKVAGPMLEGCRTTQLVVNLSFLSKENQKMLISRVLTNAVSFSLLHT
jgi:hypothetical protein